VSPSGLKELIHRPAWSKEIVVWVGSIDKLDTILEGMTQIKLDLLDLLPDDEELAASREARAELIQQGLEKFLRERKPKGGGRLILRVRNAALFARYGVGLQSFFDWFSGSRTLTILEIEQLKNVTFPATLTGVVRADPNWLLQYFKPLLAHPDRICQETS
jgi:hypothetical protein